MDWSDVLNFDQAGLSHRKIEDNILFALHNSSHPTQPHSVIANYDNDHFVDQRLDFKLLFVHLQMSLLDSTQGLKLVNSGQNNTEFIALTLPQSPVQLTPFPEYPGLQEHSKDPSVLLQSALASQWCSPVIHSFTSANQMQD